MTPHGDRPDGDGSGRPEPVPREPGRPDEPTRSGGPTSRFWALLLGGLALAAVLGVAVFGVVRQTLRPGEDAIRAAVYTAIQRETSESFLVTGTVELVATTTVSNTRTLLPGILGLNLGTTTATVRMPGRVSYGIDLSAVTPDDIEVGEDEEIAIRVPNPAVWSVEPVLDGMEVQTTVGWARLYARSGRAVEQEAIRLMESALRAQGEAHLADSDQPRRHTADALEVSLLPTLTAVGIDEPRIRVLFTDRPRQPRG